MMPDGIADAWMKLAYEEWVPACGNVSHLREPTRQIVEQLHAAVEKKDYVVAAHVMEQLRELSERFSITPTGSLGLHRYERAETLMQCARAVYKMSDKTEAMKLLLDAAGKYMGNDHCRAAVMWMLGCIQWQHPTRVNDAIFSWESSCELFAKLKETCDRLEYARWYEDWLDVMEYALDEAIHGKFVDPFLRSQWPRNPDNASRARSGSRSQESPHQEKNGNSMAGTAVPKTPKEAEALLRVFPVYESIPAGGFSYPPKETTRVEVDSLLINRIPHYVMGLHGVRLISIGQDDRIVVVKVSGESLNKLNIRDGDYVVLRTQSAPENGDIVAAEITDEASGDKEYSLKQYIRRDGRIILQPQSTVSSYPSYEFPEGSRNFRVLGIAIAVLKQVK